MYRRGRRGLRHKTRARILETRRAFRWSFDFLLSSATSAVKLQLRSPASRYDPSARTQRSVSLALPQFRSVTNTVPGEAVCKGSEVPHPREERAKRTSPDSRMRDA